MSKEYIVTACEPRLNNVDSLCDNPKWNQITLTAEDIACIIIAVRSLDYYDSQTRVDIVGKLQELIKEYL